MSPRNPVQQQVPGEVVETFETQPEAVVKTVKPAPDKQVTVSKATLDALMARVAALESQPPLQTRRANPAVALPEQDAVDVAALKNPVLTKQGWLVPETYGSNPNAPKLA